MKHVDDFIDDPSTDVYASWMLHHFRLPAILKGKFEELMKPHKLFCTYRGKRYRVTGASRLGDVWLTSDFGQSIGYQDRVDIADCMHWGDKP